MVRFCRCSRAATRWFRCTAHSRLVGYDLVPVRKATQSAYATSFIREDASWADARIDDAAHWMRRLADEPDLRAAIGKRAAADMADWQRRIDVQELVATVRNVAVRRGIPVRRTVV